MEKSDIKNKKTAIIVLCAGIFIGLLLIFAGNSFDDGESGGEGSQMNEYSIPDADEYEERVKEKVISLCSGVYGVKNVNVVVTLAGGYNAIYAQNSQSSATGYKNEFVLTGSGSSERALLIGYSTPKISGIGIVCYGGGTSYVKNEIISLVSAAFEISTNKIYVVEGQK